MAYVELTDAQVRKYVLQLDSYRLWERCVRFAREFFGPEVYNISVSTYAESDDEGGSYRVIDEIVATDREGNQPGFRKPSLAFREKYSLYYNTLLDNWPEDTNQEWLDENEGEIYDYMHDLYGEYINLPEEYNIGGSKGYSFETTVDSPPERDYERVYAQQ